MPSSRPFGYSTGRGDLVIKLRVVGASTDLDSLVLTSRKQGKRGSHVLTIDDKLFRVLEDVVRKRRAKDKGQAVKRVVAEAKLAPREVQRLLRAGRPVEQVAKLAGMDPAWVERFLGPVLDERAGAIRDSQRARVEKQRLGSSSLPLGEAVARNLRARRVRLTDDEIAAGWDASRSDAQPWTVALTFTYRGRDQRAVWHYDPRTGDVVAANRLASDLGWVGDRRVATPTPRPAVPRPTSAKARAKKRPKTRAKPAAKRRRAKPVAKRRPAATRRAKPAAKRRPVARRRPPATRRAKPAATRRPAAKRRPARTTARKTAPRRRVPASRSRGTRSAGRRRAR